MAKVWSTITILLFEGPMRRNKIYTAVEVKIADLTCALFPARGPLHALCQLLVHHHLNVRRPDQQRLQQHAHLFRHARYSKLLLHHLALFARLQQNAQDVPLPYHCRLVWCQMLHKCLRVQPVPHARHLCHVQERLLELYMLIRLQKRGGHREHRSLNLQLLLRHLLLQ